MYVPLLWFFSRFLAYRHEYDSRFNPWTDPPSLRRLATKVMTGGEHVLMPSPCGANCLYTIQFLGPYLKCNTSTGLHSQLKRVGVNENTIGNAKVYRGRWRNMNSNSNQTLERFRIMTLIIKESGVNSSFTYRNLSCIPSRAQYNLDYSFENNTLDLKSSVKPLDGRIEVRNMTKFQSKVLTSGGRWEEHQLAWYRDVNLRAILRAMTIPLQGDLSARYVISATHGGTHTPYDPHSNNTTHSNSWSTETFWEEGVKARNGKSFPSGLSGSVI